MFLAALEAEIGTLCGMYPDVVVQKFVNSHGEYKLRFTLSSNHLNFVYHPDLFVDFGIYCVRCVDAGKDVRSFAVLSESPVFSANQPLFTISVLVHTWALNVLTGHQEHRG